jgi:hypothetical protein
MGKRGPTGKVWTFPENKNPSRSVEFPLQIEEARRRDPGVRMLDESARNGKIEKGWRRNCAEEGLEVIQRLPNRVTGDNDSVLHLDGDEPPGKRCCARTVDLRARDVPRDANWDELGSEW